MTKRLKMKIRLRMAWQALTSDAVISIAARNLPEGIQVGRSYSFNVPLSAMPMIFTVVHNAVMTSQDRELGSRATLEGFQDILHGSSHEESVD